MDSSEWIRLLRNRDVTPRTLPQLVVRAVVWGVSFYLAILGFAWLSDRIFGGDLLDFVRSGYAPVISVLTAGSMLVRDLLRLRRARQSAEDVPSDLPKRLG